MKQRGESISTSKTVTNTVKDEYRMVVESFNEAARVYHDKLTLDEQTVKKFQVGMKFLETPLPLSVDDLNRLSRLGATVRGGNVYQSKSKAMDTVREDISDHLLYDLQRVAKMLPSLSQMEIEQLAASLEQALATVVEYRSHHFV